MRKSVVVMALLGLLSAPAFDASSLPSTTSLGSHGTLVDLPTPIGGTGGTTPGAGSSGWGSSQDGGSNPGANAPAGGHWTANPASFSVKEGEAKTFKLTWDATGAPRGTLTGRI